MFCGTFTRFAHLLGWWNGRHVRLRGVCRKACGFKSRPEHHLLSASHLSLDGIIVRKQKKVESGRISAKETNARIAATVHSHASVGSLSATSASIENMFPI